VDHLSVSPYTRVTNFQKDPVFLSPIFILYAKAECEIYTDVHLLEDCHWATERFLSLPLGHEPVCHQHHCCRDANIGKRKRGMRHWRRRGRKARGEVPSIPVVIALRALRSWPCRCQNQNSGRILDRVSLTQCRCCRQWTVHTDCSSYLRQFVFQHRLPVLQKYIQCLFWRIHISLQYWNRGNIFRNKSATWSVQASGILCSMINSMNRVWARITLKSLLLVKKCWMLRGGLLSTLAACFLVFTCLSTSPIPSCPTLKSQRHNVQYANKAATPDLRITGCFNSYSYFCRYFCNTLRFFTFGPSGCESSFSILRSDIQVTKNFHSKQNERRFCDLN